MAATHTAAQMATYVHKAVDANLAQNADGAGRNPDNRRGNEQRHDDKHQAAYDRYHVDPFSVNSQGVGAIDKRDPQNCVPDRPHRQ